ncbi:MAG TPA: prolyl oligopeptidase family serine peptidase [Gemmatimonadales bacterium]|nr:prolyl oligopeptidase family serine peptidase [Gemmatimonadales bacterium]
MRTLFALAGLAALVTSAARAQTPGCTRPVARADSQVDTYFGTAVRDPYRWLENTDAADTKAWVAAENCVTFAYLESIPERAHIRERLARLWNYERYGVPWREGGTYVFSRNDGLQNQSVYYWQRSLDAQPRLLIDPNTLSSDGTVALTTWDVSDDGRYFGYGTAAAGSDWNELHVRRIATGRDLPDRLRWVKFSGLSWTHDDAGFFYSRYPTPAGNVLQAVVKNQKLYYHRLGTPQSADRLVYERPDQPDWGFGGSVTEDGRYLVIHVSLGTDSRNRVYYLDMGNRRRPRLGGRVVRLLDGFDASYGFVGNRGPVFYFTTNLDAPRGRLIAIDTRHPAPADWTVVIPQTDQVLDGVTLVGGRFVARYLQDAHGRLAVFDADGRSVGEIALPGLGTVGAVSGRADRPEMFYAFTSFLFPTTVFRYDVATGAGAVWKAPHLDFDPGAYETEQVFYRSRDGTRVPMFLTHRRGLVRDSANPVLLTAYGGFDISNLPSFSVANAVWLEMGGVVALANLRGGGEYGEEWHQAGMHERKQNVFDDFIAAAEYLVREGWTRPARLAIEGASNGGLLVGAVENERPDLFGATLPGVGVMDMLRFQRFTIGWAWVTEYGSSDSAGQFPYLYAYSPLHNIRSGIAYPATLVTTADHDDRVVPGHSFKYAATLQAAQAGPAPVLIRVETRAGHGGGMPVSKQIELVADQWAFLVKNLGMTLP